MTKRIDFARLSIRLAVFVLLLALLAVITFRMNLVGFQIALPGLAVSALSGLLAALLGTMGLFIAMRHSKNALSALIGLLLGVVTAMPVLFSMLAGADVPRIHDIATDLDAPPVFEVIPNLRPAADNPLDRKLPENLAELQREGYPDLQPLLLNRPRNTLFEQAPQLAKSHGWHIEIASTEKEIIEATASTAIMAFKDDGVIRIQGGGQSARVDMRSVSRVGVSDLGANAKRIRQFLADLDRL